MTKDTTNKKADGKPSALSLLSATLFVVLAVVGCDAFASVCYSDLRKLATVVFAVMTTSANITSDCLLVIHGVTSFLS